MTTCVSDSTGALRLASEKALSYLAHLEDRAVLATAGAQELRTRFGKPLPECGSPPEDVIESLVRDAEDGLNGISGGRFFGWVNGGALPAALAADWLASAWGQNAAIFATSPAAAVVEEVAGAWLKDLLRIPKHASFAFVTGCQMAHVTCLAAARHALLAARGFDVEAKGLAGSPAIRVISSARRHASIDRAIRLLGIGTDALVLIEPDGSEILDMQTLRTTLARSAETPTIVLLQAADINTGAFDNFAEVIPVAKSFGAWVHVDGAFGLWASASPRYEHCTSGIEQADSWATDGHKMLNVPFDCGYAFVSDSAAHRAAFSVSAAYIAAASDGRDALNWNPEWSRRARAFPTYAAIMELGRDGIAETVDRLCSHARNLVDGLSPLPGVEVLWYPSFNQGLLRFGNDDRTSRVVEHVAQSGEAFFTPTVWRESVAMRVSVVNWRTSEADVERAVRAVKKALRQA